MNDAVRIGEMLMSLSACPPEALEEALHNQWFFGGRVGTNLLRIGAVSEKHVADALARMHRIAAVSGDVVPEPRALSLLRRSAIERHKVVPYAVDGRLLRLVMCDPNDMRALDEIAFATGKRIERVVAAELRVWTLMREHYGIEQGLRGIGDDGPRRWAPRLNRARDFVQPLAGDVWR